MFKPLMSKIMKEAHAAAKADLAWDRAQKGASFVRRSYGYYLGLQMRNGFAEARIAITGMASAFNLPAERWC